jgi:hypothetical protein
MTDRGELSQPVQQGSDDATRGQKIAGLAEQVAADLRDRPQADLLAELHLRLTDAGIDVDADELVALADNIARER